MIFQIISQQSNPSNFSNCFFTNKLKNNIIRKMKKNARAKITNKDLAIYLTWNS